MMSMFSYFDVLLGDASTAKGFSSSSSSSSAVKKERENSIKNGDRRSENSATSLPENVSTTATTRRDHQKRSPRFAPEIDGVHCFETILPY
uniref:Avr9/Cf-9 rapidly elicited protein n=1 Tax=Cannabis sativa TaxID=3483 RepID=A0A803QXU4_CANSA